MNALIAPLYGMAGLLAAAGVLKLAEPTSTRGALEAVGLPSGRSTVQALGVVEIVIGLAVIVTGAPAVTAAMAAAYLAFAGFVTIALVRKLPIASCGCFGKEDTPPSRFHLVVTGAASVLAIAATLDPVGPLTKAVADAGNPLVVGGAAVIAFLAYLTITALPRSMAYVGDGARGPRLGPTGSRGS